jgi:MFS family permease
VPRVGRVLLHSDTELTPAHVWQTLYNKALTLQNIGIFILHAILTATFIAIPIAIIHIVNFSIEYHGLIYISALIPAFLFMALCIIIAEKKHYMKQVYIFSIIMVMLPQILLSIWSHSYFSMGLALFLFFSGFITLEALIPSLISKIAPAGQKGTALTFYSSAQFLGMFIGGAVGGLLLHLYNIYSVFMFNIVLTVLWLILALFMKQYSYISNYSMYIGPMHKADAIRLQTQLRAAPGVIEAVVDYKSEVAYLKIDKRIVKFEELQSITVSIHR